MAALIAVLAVGFLAWSRLDPGSSRGTDSLEIVSRNATHGFRVEVARTPDQQATGLMFRSHLAQDAGMLFAHDAPHELSMWMRNTYIPLDMLFIRQDGVIHRIEANTTPFSEEIIASEGDVSAVLELAGGTAAKLGIIAGDRVRHPVFTKAP